MKIHVGWFFLSLVAITVLLSVLWYQSSWIPDYGEAEPLFPVAADFGSELAEKAKNKKIELEDLEFLLSEDRFSKLRPYGIILTKNKSELVVLKINKTYSFRIGKDGGPQWEKRKSNQPVQPTSLRSAADR
jgi:hypothetical protein